MITKVAWIFTRGRQIILQSSDDSARPIFGQIHNLLTESVREKLVIEQLAKLSGGPGYALRALNSDGSWGPGISVPVLYLLASEFGWLPEGERVPDCPWSSMVALQENPPVFPAFEPAAKDFLERVFAMLMEGTTYQVLETMCWLEPKVPDVKIHIPPIMFYDLRDLLGNAGWSDTKSQWIGKPVVSPGGVMPVTEVPATAGP